jgi:hypothetical protein|tara:strand:+ start:659 stop:1117 length:459 start_codon:yes stop_codon:yes gene_type:complete
MTATTLEKPNTVSETMYKYSDLANLLAGLIEVEELKGVKFALKVSKNIRLVRSELTELENAAQPSDEFLKLATIVQGIEASESSDVDVKRKEIEELEEKNKEVIEVRKAQILEFQKVMEEYTDITLFKLSEQHLPSDITAKQIDNISLIIKE